MITTGKIYISSVLLIIDVYLSFLWLITSNLQLPTLFYCTHIPDEFIEFSEFNKILKGKNPIHLSLQWSSQQSQRLL